MPNDGLLLPRWLVSSRLVRGSTGFALFSPRKHFVARTHFVYSPDCPPSRSLSNARPVMNPERRGLGIRRNPLENPRVDPPPFISQQVTDARRFYLNLNPWTHRE